MEQLHDLLMARSKTLPDHPPSTLTLERQRRSSDLRIFDQSVNQSVNQSDQSQGTVMKMPSLCCNGRHLSGASAILFCSNTCIEPHDCHTIANIWCRHWFVPCAVFALERLWVRDRAWSVDIASTAKSAKDLRKLSNSTQCCIWGMWHA